MGKQIIKQPNGKYAVWSSIVDDFVYADGDVDGLISFYMHEAKDRITRDVKEIISKLEKKQKPYYQFTMSFEMAIKTIQENHGENAESLVFLKEQEVI